MATAVTPELVQTFEGGADGGLFGTAVAVDGNRMLVGAPEANPNGESSGAA